MTQWFDPDGAQAKGVREESWSRLDQAREAVGFTDDDLEGASGVAWDEADLLGSICRTAVIVTVGGVGTVSGAVYTPESLIESADAAMYEAKDRGRDRVVAAGGEQEREKEKRRRRTKTARASGGT